MKFDEGRGTGKSQGKEEGRGILSEKLQPEGGNLVFKLSFKTKGGK